MTDTNDRLVQPQDFWLALGLLSRVPVPGADPARAARSGWAFPLVGLVLAGLAGFAGLTAGWLGLPPPLAALAALAVLIVLSGAMHEDGLADTADGFWGGWTRQRRLDIMKDSHIGTYGMVALFLGLAARWSALWLLFTAGPAQAVCALLASAALSRAGMPLLMATLPHARDDGLSRGVGAVPASSAALGAAIAVIAALALLGGGFFWPVVWSGLALAGLGWLARERIGGQTGDVLGASQQITEIAVLLSLLA